MLRRRSPHVTRTARISYRDALREALVQEMTRDNRVIHYGEDVADYGGAFKLTKGLLEAFGRERVFNTPISEACICGTAVGASMVGLRPVVELMYMDFALMSSDQIANQAAKWHYMSGAQVEVPLVIRASVGAGQGLRRPAQPVPREHLHPHPRPVRRLPVDAGRREGPPQPPRSGRTTRCCSSRARASTRRRASCPMGSTSSRSGRRGSPARAPTSRSSAGARPCRTCWLPPRRWPPITA